MTSDPYYEEKAAKMFQTLLRPGLGDYRLGQIEAIRDVNSLATGALSHQEVAKKLSRLRRHGNPGYGSEFVVGYEGMFSTIQRTLNDQRPLRRKETFADYVSRVDVVLDDPQVLAKALALKPSYKLPKR